MKHMEFTPNNNGAILFGVILPDIVYDLYNVCISQTAFEDVLRFRLNIDRKRVIRMAEAVSVESKRQLLILVVYDIFMSEKNMLKTREQIVVEDFDFPTYEYNTKLGMDIERLISYRG